MMPSVARQYKHIAENNLHPLPLMQEIQAKRKDPQSILHLQKIKKFNQINK